MSKFYLVYKNSSKLMRLFSAYKKEEFDNASDCCKRLVSLSIKTSLQDVKIYKDSKMITTRELDVLCDEEKNDIIKQINKKEKTQSFNFIYHKKLIFKLYVDEDDNFGICDVKLKESNNEEILSICMCDNIFFTEYSLFQGTLPLFSCFRNIDGVGCFIYEIFKESVQKGNLIIDYKF